MYKRRKSKVRKIVRQPKTHTHNLRSQNNPSKVITIKYWNYYEFIKNQTIYNMRTRETPNIMIPLKQKVM